jgi:tetratricopeptide (TPR) repeat protein
LNNKGATLHGQRKYDEAVQMYDKAIRLKPDFAGAYYNKGLALKALKKTRESDAAFTKAKELSSG